MSRFPLIILLLASAASVTTMSARADWADLLDKFKDSTKELVSASSVADATGVSEADIIGGLKEALNTATATAVTALGKKGGFLKNPEVRIPLPDELRWVEKSLRGVGQEALADDFIRTMNRAAEKAVPAALEQFQAAISAMSLEDAKGILEGPDDAATAYFRKHSESELREQFLPLVEKTTAKAGVTSAYKNMTASMGDLAGMFGTRSLDVDEYVTDKTLDGLFTMVAQEEARIREDPLARSTELLEKVFGGG